MATHDIIVVGASAGGVEALKQLVSLLPADLPAAIFIVLHVPAHGTSVLPQILTRSGKLPAVHAKDQQRIEPGHIYVAPPDHHLVVKRGYVRITHGPHENRQRPAADVLFRSVARSYGRRVVGVVLSGTLDDGTAGLIAVKMQGGISIVQDPAEALYNGMPLSAIEYDHVDYILPLAEIAQRLNKLAHEEVVEADVPVPNGMEQEVDVAEEEREVYDTPPGAPAVFACPSCGGSLWELQDGDLSRFRCRVGHAFSAQSLLAEQSDRLEDAFWVALRALEESANLARRMAERAQERGQNRSYEQFMSQTKSAEENAKIIRDVLQAGLMRFAEVHSGEAGSD
jgi:two-component system chemotaxis response regulator CheB